jgi:hypothetical protein
MSTPTYADEKQHLDYVAELDSDGDGAINTLTALIAEGENPFNPIY